MAPLARKPKVRLMDTAAFPCAPKTGRANERPEAWFRSDVHLAWIRTLPCACGCGGIPANDNNPIEAAHVRTFTDGAAGVKPSDIFVLPLTMRCHRIQHSMSEAAFWRDRNVVDPAGLALSYALRSPCERTRKIAAAEIAGEPWRAAA